jgi:hypoxanthine phosphoribosyltransferase
MMNDLGLPRGARTVVSTEHLDSLVADLAQQIAEEYSGEDLRLVTILKGGLFFLTDLCRAIPAPLSIDFVSLQPYAQGGGGVVRLTKDLSDDIEGASVILVEDVIDTGLTSNYVLGLLRSHRPKRLEVCALLDKPARRIADVPIAFRGLEMRDEFLVGYGLDLNGRYRNLPFVAALPDEAVF